MYEREDKGENLTLLKCNYMSEPSEGGQTGKDVGIMKTWKLNIRMTQKQLCTQCLYTKEIS